MTPDDLGRIVRETWVDWARQQPGAKPSWLVPWSGLDEGQREVDRRIGAAVAAASLPRCPTPCDDDCEQACHEVHRIRRRREHYPETCVATLATAAADQGAAAERARIAELLRTLRPEFMDRHGAFLMPSVAAVLAAAAAEIEGTP